MKVLLCATKCFVQLDHSIARNAGNSQADLKHHIAKKYPKIQAKKHKSAKFIWRSSLGFMRYEITDAVIMEIRSRQPMLRWILSRKLSMLQNRKRT